MRAASGQSASLVFPRCLRLGLALLCMSPLRLLSHVDPARGLPPCVASTLHWLPEDTETLVVARSVTLPELKPGTPFDRQWQELGVGLATGELDLVDGGKLTKPLLGRKIECIVCGARNFQSVSKFGSLRSERCTIIVFEKDLGDAAREWTDGLRKGARAVRTVAGREVFVFPSTTIKDSWAGTESWEGTFFVLLKPDVLLCASSDRYLESVLRRVDGAAGVRALPDNLPEWRHVDFNTPVWLIRHVPKARERAHAVGATARFLRNGFRVVYIPRPGFDVNLAPIKQEWLRLPQGDQLKFISSPDGTVVGSCGEGISDNTLSFAFQLYWLQAFELTIGGE